MNYLILVLLSFLSVSSKSQRWVIDRSSRLIIAGKSNVSSFQCDINEYINPDTVTIYPVDRSGFHHITGGLKIKINQVDCHQKFMTGDFRKTLKSVQFPFLTVEFQSIGSLTHIGSAIRVNGRMAITIAGTTKQIQVVYLVNNSVAGELLLNGTQRVNFSDFGLIPPTNIR